MTDILWAPSVIPVRSPFGTLVNQAARYARTRLLGARRMTPYQGFQQVYIVVPNKETQVFDAVTGRNLQVAWAKHDFAALDMSPDGKSVAGAEVDESGLHPQRLGKTDGAVRLLLPDSDR